MYSHFSLCIHCSAIEIGCASELAIGGDSDNIKGGKSKS